MKKISDVLILQPPVAQLNTAYPSGAYLSSFFKSLGYKTRWIDLNIELFYEIFSKSGLEKLFSLCSQNALHLAQKAEEQGNNSSAFNLRRYVSQKNLWIQWIDFITAILRPKAQNSICSGYENAHRFVFGAHVPRGSRMETYLLNLDHELSTDDARALASFALADLADFINVAFDKNFSLVRYAESLTVSESTFAQIEKGADSPILKEFYEPLLKRLFMKGELGCSTDCTNGCLSFPHTTSTSSTKSTSQNRPTTLVLISVPFAGTFAAALSTGRFFKNHFGKSVYISFGGGFVNTELRDTTDRSLVKYCDALCFDRGYASYAQLLKNPSASFASEETINSKKIYKLRQFVSGTQKEFDSSASDLAKENVFVIEALSSKENPESYKQAVEYEKQVTSSLIPDFLDIDFSKYPRLIDDTNPMHRLWSDGAWIKAYMAHGCYWHKCSFCDVTLDYVNGFCPTNIHNLYEGLFAQCKQKGIYGIHFVDEAMPPALMIAFAHENILHGSPITWWGNIRFEKQFTRDVADFLAYGGLIGVSAGLESATGNGLTAIHKGTDLQSIVAACCAFKEAGVLVHAYMIYGYWWESEQDLINSMETLRQFYENGLLDSCFWHKFVLTRHSRAYKEWQEGKIPNLEPIDPQNQKNAPLFAKNGLHFKGEKNSQKYGNSLEFSLNEWMHARDINRPVQKWFAFSVAKPTVEKKFIKNLIEKYEQKRDAEFAKEIPSSVCEDNKKIFWLGGEKIPIGKNDIGWFYMGEYYEAKKDAPLSAFRGKGLCVLP